MKRNVEKIEFVLKKITAKQGHQLKEAVIFNKISALWPQIVSGDLKQQTQLMDYKNYVLFIGVKSPVWAQQIVFFKEEIINKIKKLKSTYIIKDIKTKILSEFLPMTDDDNEVLVKIKAEEIRAEEEQLKEVELTENLKNKLVLAICKAKKMAAKDQRKICPNCGLKHNGTQALCIRCDNKKEKKEIRQVREYLAEVPWSRYKDIAQEIKINEEQYHQVKEDLIKKAGDIIKNAKYLPNNELTSKNREFIKKTILKYAMLRSGLPPKELTVTILEEFIGKKLYKKVFL